MAGWLERLGGFSTESSSNAELAKKAAELLSLGLPPRHLPLGKAVLWRPDLWQPQFTVPRGRWAMRALRGALDKFVRRLEKT